MKPRTGPLLRSSTKPARKTVGSRHTDDETSESDSNSARRVASDSESTTRYFLSKLQPSAAHSRSQARASLVTTRARPAEPTSKLIHPAPLQPAPTPSPGAVAVTPMEADPIVEAASSAAAAALNAAARLDAIGRAREEVDDGGEELLRPFTFTAAPATPPPPALNQHAREQLTQLTASLKKMAPVRATGGAESPRDAAITEMRREIEKMKEERRREQLAQQEERQRTAALMTEMAAARDAANEARRAAEEMLLHNTHAPTQAQQAARSQSPQVNAHDTGGGATQVANTHSDTGGTGSDSDESDEDERKEMEDEARDDEVYGVVYEEMPAGAGSDPYRSYNAWLKTRERVYPCMQKGRESLYEDRWSLLNEQEREMEYYRFGFAVRFPPALYPSSFGRLDEYVDVKAGVPVTRTHPRARAFDMRSLMVPPFYYDNRDDAALAKQRHKRENEKDDVPSPSSFVLNGCGLPLVLQGRPPASARMRVPTTVQEVIRGEITRRRLRAAAKGPEARVPRGRDTVASASSAEDDDDSDGESAAATTTEDGRPPLETDALTGAAMFDAPPMATRSASGAGKMSASSATAPPAKDEAKVDPEPNEEKYVARLLQELRDWRTRRVKKEEERDTEVAAKEEENKPGKAPSSAKPTQKMGGPPRRCVLAPMWEELDPTTRNMIALTCETGFVDEATLKKRELNAIDKCRKFDGNPTNAPVYYNELCRYVGEMPYTSQHAIRIMIGTTTSTASTWVTSVMESVYASVGEKDAFVALMRRFKNDYLGTQQASMWRKQLHAHKLTGTNITLQELETH